MNTTLFLLILGDCILVTLMGFYAGVGIWESGTVGHILGLTLPSIAVWLLLAFLFKIYLPNYKTFIPAFTEQSSLLQKIKGVITGLNDYQQPVRLVPVWLLASLFAIFWQSFYWRNILHSSFHAGLTKWLFIWYGSSCMVFFVFWRLAWTFVVAGNVFAAHSRKYAIFCYAVFLFSVFFQVNNVVLAIHYAPLRYSISNVPENIPETALVFGAGVYMNGEPSAILTDRVLTAVDLYRQGKIKRMIMSGDNADSSRNEVDKMVNLATENGVPVEAILRDNAGINSRTSCLNAHETFGLDSVTLITNDFHANRTLMTAEYYGLENCVVVRSDRRIYNLFSWGTWYLRDWLGTPIYWLRFHSPFAKR